MMGVGQAQSISCCRNASNDVSPLNYSLGTHLIFLDIVRILLMVPIYAAISFGSYLYWVSPMSSCSSFPVFMACRITRPPCCSSVTATSQLSLRRFSICSSTTYRMIRKNRRKCSAECVPQHRIIILADLTQRLLRLGYLRSMTGTLGEEAHLHHTGCSPYSLSNGSQK